MQITLKYPLILASQSPRRQQILNLMGFEFSIQASNINESKTPQRLSPFEIPEWLARSKAQHISKSYREKLIIGFDTSVFLGKEIMGKPSNSKDALRMLNKLNGKTHHVMTGVSLAKNGRTLKSCTEITKVKFCKTDEHLLKNYSTTKEPLDKAGSYAIQGQAALFVEKINGCYYNVVGVPIHKTFQLLQPYIY